MSRRIAWTLVAGLLGALVLALALLAWVATTEAGLRWAADRARPWLPDGVAFESLEGRLVGPLRIDGLRLEAGAARVAVERVGIEWSPRALLAGRLQIDRLTVDGVDVAAAPGPGAAASGPPALPDALAPPLRVRVGAVRIADVRLRPPAGEPIAVERVTFAASAGPEGIALEGLELDAPMLALRGRAGLDGRPPFALDGRLHGRVRHAAMAGPVAGTLRLAGSLREPRARLSLSAPQRLELSLRARPFAEPLLWGAHIEGDDIVPARWLAGAPALPLRLDLRAAGEDARAAVDGAFALEQAPLGRVAGRVDARIDPGGARIAALELTLPGTPARLQARGRVDWPGAAPRVDLRLAWEALRWPPGTDDGPLRAATGSGRVEGTPDAYRLELDSRVTAAGLAAGRWRGRARGDTDGLDEIGLTGEWLGAAWSADGRVDWSAGIAGAATLRVHGLDPARLGTPLAGAVDAAVDLDLRADGAGAPALDARLVELGGRLHEAPLSGAGRARYADGRLELADLRLGAGDARLAVDGAVGERLALSLHLEVPDLALLAPGAGGALALEADVAGAPAAPRARVRAQGRDLRYGDASVTETRLSARVHADGARSSRIDVTALGLEAAGRRVQRLALSLDGRPGGHELAASAEADAGSVALRARGGLDGGAWEGRPTALEVTPAGRPAWRLAEAGALRAGADGVTSARQCLEQGAARACVAGTWRRGKRWQARWGLEGLPLQVLVDLWRPGLEVRGTVAGEGRLAGGAGPPTGKAALALSAGAVRGTVEGVRETLAAWDAGEVELGLDADRARLRLALPLAPAGHLRADVSAGRGGEGPLEGRVSAAVEQLDLVPVLLPALETGGARLRGDVALGGTRAQPQARGEVRVAEGTLGVPRLGLTWEALRLSLDTDGRRLHLAASGRSGDGELAARAVLARADDGAWHAAGTVDGEAVTLVDTTEARIAVSPELRWRADPGAVTVEGTVRVPSARLAPHDLSGAVRPSGDARVVGAEAAPAAPGWQLTADVGVELGDDVRFDGFGLGGRLEGALQVRERPGELTTATGELRVIDGAYRAYRQTLTIEEGRLIFAGGPLADPGLDIRAVRRPRDVLVGVHVRGTLREPRPELFSEPAMPESQVLSHLVLGVPLDETGEDDRGVLAGAAATMGLAGGEWLARRLGGRVGVSDVRVEAGDDPAEAALVLGKYLTPRLYVSYGIGLFEAANAVRLRYDLARQWTLAAESGATSSTDLLYSIER